jgi:hypothetical protein
MMHLAYIFTCNVIKLYRWDAPQLDVQITFARQTLRENPTIAHRIKRETLLSRVSKDTSHITTQNGDAQVSASHFYSKIEMSIGYARLPFLLEKMGMLSAQTVLFILMGRSPRLVPPYAGHLRVTTSHCPIPITTSRRPNKRV